MGHLSEALYCSRAGLRYSLACDLKSIVRAVDVSVGAQDECEGTDCAMPVFSAQ